MQAPDASSQSEQQDNNVDADFLVQTHRAISLIDQAKIAKATAKAMSSCSPSVLCATAAVAIAIVPPLPFQWRCLLAAVAHCRRHHSLQL
jgi:hypothetical protein